MLLHICHFTHRWNNIGCPAEYEILRPRWLWSDLRTDIVQMQNEIRMSLTISSDPLMKISLSNVKIEIQQELTEPNFS